MSSRLSRGNRIERELRVDFDEVIKDDFTTYQTLLRIQQEYGDKNGALQNVLRKYYSFTYNKDFPSILNCKKRFG